MDESGGIGFIGFILFWTRAILALVLLALAFQSGWVVALFLVGLSGYLLYGLWRDFKRWRDS